MLCLLAATGSNSPSLHIRFLERGLSRTLLFQASPKGWLHDLNVRLRQGRPRVQPRALMTIFGRSVDCCLRPVTSLDPKFWWYIIRRFGSLGGQSWSSFAAGIAARLLHKISLFDKSLSRSKLINLSRVHCSS